MGFFANFFTGMQGNNSTKALITVPLSLSRFPQGWPQPIVCLHLSSASSSSFLTPTNFMPSFTTGTFQLQAINTVMIFTFLTTYCMQHLANIQRTNVHTSRSAIVQYVHITTRHLKDREDSQNHTVLILANILLEVDNSSRFVCLGQHKQTHVLRAVEHWSYEQRQSQCWIVTC